MSHNSRNGSNREYEERDERSPLLPHHAHRNKAVSSSSSVASFIKDHTFSPLPDFDSPSSLPLAYVPPLLLQCLISGLADASTFTLTKTWVGFMSGSLVQVVINSFDYLLPSDSNAGNSTEDTRAKLISNVSALIGFILGCQLTSNLVLRVATDRTKRITIVLFSFYRCIATLVIVLLGMKYSAFRLQGSLGWLVNSILAASLGCQSTYSTDLATPFSNTVVFTATLTSVSSDLHLPMLHLDKANRFKLLSLIGLLGGAALSQTILKVATKASQRDKHEAVQHALLVLAGMELLLGVSWYLCGIAANWEQHRSPEAQNHEDEE